MNKKGKLSILVSMLLLPLMSLQPCVAEDVPVIDKIMSSDVHALTCGYAMVYLSGPTGSFKGGHVYITNVSSSFKSAGVAYWFGIGFTPIEWVTAGIIDKGDGPKLFIDHYIDSPQSYQLWESGILMDKAVLVCLTKLNENLWNIRLIENGIKFEQNVTVQGSDVLMMLSSETCSLNDVIHADFYQPTSWVYPNDFIHWWLNPSAPYERHITYDFPYVVNYVPYEIYRTENLVILKNGRGGKTIGVVFIEF